jgi:hypothetical protein
MFSHGARPVAAAPGKRGNGISAPAHQMVNAQIAANARRQPERAQAGGRAAPAAEKTRPSILSTIKAKPKAGRK